jgi:autotransporter passenger strand-loop-strand repeat protein
VVLKSSLPAVLPAKAWYRAAAGCSWPPADPTLILGGGTEIVSAGGADVGAQISGGTQVVFGLPIIAFGANTTVAYLQNAGGAGGTLTVSDGRHAASIALLANYIAGSFAIAADGHGGTLVTAAEQTQQPQLTRPHG